MKKRNKFRLPRKEKKRNQKALYRYFLDFMDGKINEVEFLIKIRK